MFNSLINVKRIIFITILSSLSITGFSQKYSDESIENYCHCIINNFEMVFKGRLVEIDTFSEYHWYFKTKRIKYKFKLAIDSIQKGLQEDFIWTYTIFDEYGYIDSSELGKSRIYKISSMSDKYIISICKDEFDEFGYIFIPEIDNLNIVLPSLNKIALNTFSIIISGKLINESFVYDTLDFKTDSSELIIKERKLEFQVYEWFNGDNGTDKTFVYTLPLDANGLNFKIGEDYLVYAEKTDFIIGEIRYRAMKPTSLSLPLKFADKHIEILRDLTQK